MTDDAPKTALLVVDMQVDLLAAHGRLPVAATQVPGLLAATNDAIADAERRGEPVIYVTNHFHPLDPANLFRRGACVAQRPGTELDPRVRLAPNALHTVKGRGDGFSNPALDALLRDAGVKRLVIVGVYAGGCIRATARGGLRRGYQVVVPSDGVADRSEAARTRALHKLAADGAQVTPPETSSLPRIQRPRLHMNP